MLRRNKNQHILAIQMPDLLLQQNFVNNFINSDNNAVVETLSLEGNQELDTEMLIPHDNPNVENFDESYIYCFLTISECIMITIKIIMTLVLYYATYMIFLEYFGGSFYKN